MSGGGSQVTNSTPWASATPYLTDVMGQAQSLYDSSNPQYANPASNFGFGQATGAVGNALGGTTTLGGMASQLSPVASNNISTQFANPFGTTGNLDATSAINHELSGTPDYTAVNGAVDAANTQQWNQFYNQVVPQLNQRASFLGNPSGSIKDLNSAVAQIGQSQSLNAQQAYLGQYNNAQQQQQTAAGLVASGGLQGQSNATSLGGLAGGLASSAGSQALSGAQLYPTISTQPQQNLADYGSIISNTGGKFSSGSTSINPGASGTAANVIGGLTAGTGLLNQLFGSPATAGGSGVSGVSGLAGLLSSLFGSSGSNYNQLGQFLSSGNTPGSTAISGQYTNPLDQFGGSYYGMVNDPSMTGFGSLSGADPNSGLYDPGTINWGPSGAGGQAATSNEPTASNFQSTDNQAVDAYQQTNDVAPTTAPASGLSGLGAAQGAYGIYSGLSSGTPVGYASAGLGATSLGAKAGAFGGDSGMVGGAAGIGGSALGLYSGLQQGGTVGDTKAALSAAQLAAPVATYAGAGALGSTLAAAGPLSLALAPALIGMSTPAVQLTGKYWSGVQDSLQQAIASGDRGEIAQQVNGLLSQPQSQIPSNIQQLVYSTGFVPSSGWGLQSATPAQLQALVQQSGGLKGGSSGSISVGHK